MNVFIKNGFFCLVEKNAYEVNEKYNYRANLIVSKKPENQKEFDNYVKLSNYASNINFLGCHYPKHIEDRCKEFTSNDQN